MLLVLLVLVPVLGAAVLGFYPGTLSGQQARQGAIVVALAMMGLTIAYSANLICLKQAFRCKR
jgi:hypothetical protein